ncbi:MAG: 2OG-Fe(II) oxygenase [Pseudomonadota bacterium]
MDQNWLAWARLNVARGCDRDELAKILLEHDFHPVAIISALQYVPKSSELIAVMNQRLQAMGSPAVASASTVVTDPVSVFQAIDAVTLASAIKLESTKVHLYLIDNFLTDAECDELVKRIKDKARPSTITNPNEPDKYFRTSKTCDLSVDADEWIQQLDHRIANYMGIEPERSEGIQGQHYQVGEEFKVHTDYFQPNTPEYEKFAGARGQRTWTFMIYLNDVEAGGETTFPRIPLTIEPKKGMAVAWNSLYPDGAVNPDTAHWAKPLVRGEKTIVTKWFRTHGSLTTPFRKGTAR